MGDRPLVVASSYANTVASVVSFEELKEGARPQNDDLGIFFFCGQFLNVYNTCRRSPMPQSLFELEQQRFLLAAQLSRLGDLRPGSVTGIVRRCGKPTCHCAQPDDPGHGPTLRLTYKVQGKTIS